VSLWSCDTRLVNCGEWFRENRTDRMRYRKQRACKEKSLMMENKKIWSCFNNE